ncbi:hypothetical protein ACOMHN_008752 [Nucella lapillus]
MELLFSSLLIVVWKSQKADLLRSGDDGRGTLRGQERRVAGTREEAHFSHLIVRLWRAPRSPRSCLAARLSSALGWRHFRLLVMPALQPPPGLSPLSLFSPGPPPKKEFSASFCCLRRHENSTRYQAAMTPVFWRLQTRRVPPLHV